MTDKPEEQLIADVNVKDWVYGTTTIGTLFSGQVLFIGEYVNVEGVKERMYRIGVVNQRYIDLYDSELMCLQKVEQYNKREYLKGLEDKLKIKCFDEVGEIYATSVILAKLFDDENKWNELTEEEKQEFVENIPFYSEDIIEVFNCYYDVKKDRDKLNAKYLNALDAIIHFMDRINSFKQLAPEFSKAYDMLFNLIGVDELIGKVTVRKS